MRMTHLKPALLSFVSLINGTLTLLGVSKEWMYVKLCWTINLEFTFLFFILFIYLFIICSYIDFCYIIIYIIIYIL